MIDERLLAQIRTRLEHALAAPSSRHLPLLVERTTVGWLAPARAARLCEFPQIFTVTQRAIELNHALDTVSTRSGALATVAHALANADLLTAWRDEAYAVAPALHAPALFHLERAAARFFGIVTYAAHVNGLVPHDDHRFGKRYQSQKDATDTGMWLARRSSTKSIDPGELDNLIGGGMRASTSIKETVEREAWEEAGIESSMASYAQPAGVVQLCRERPDGLQREVIFVHDLMLPASFTPIGIDGEACDHRLVSLDEAARLIAIADGPDVVTADASLVILDCLLRHGMVAADSAHYLALAALRVPSLDVQLPGGD